MSYHRKINITIIILSSVAVFLQTLLLAIQTLYDTKIFQIIVAVINATLIAIQSVQLNLKKEADNPSPKSDIVHEGATIDQVDV